MKMARTDWSDEKLFFRLLNNKSDRTYWDNIRILRKRPTKDVFDRAIELTHSNNKNAKEIGIDILAQLGGLPRPFYRASITRYFELLETEEDPEIVYFLLSAIGHNNDNLSQIQIEQLCSFADTDNKLVKKGLVDSLLRVDNPKAIDMLIKLSSDKVTNVRDWATFGLGNQTDRNNRKIREALWARVNDKDQDTRYEAIFGLARRKDMRVKEIIRRELLGGEYGEFLFEAIIEIAGKEFLPILKNHLSESEGDRTINPSWLESLKNCIDELNQVPIP